MSTIQAVVADPHRAERLVIREVPAPSPAPSEAIVILGKPCCMCLANRH